MNFLFLTTFFPTMYNALQHKIDSLSPEDQKEVEKFVSYLIFRSLEHSENLSNEEETEIHNRIREMKEYPDASVRADHVFAEIKAKYGR